MTGRTHDLAAITALGITFLVLSPANISLATAILAILANLIGGITPDIDQPTAPLWRNLPVGRYFGKLFGILSGGHRFLTHSFIGVALLGWLFWLLLNFLHPVLGSVNVVIVWWAFLIGVLSHLLFDLFTKEGVPLLLPIPIKFGFPPIKALRITTGKFIESFIVFPGLLVANLLIYMAHYGQLLTLIHSFRA
jgi:membrane-bound metal-dependent hydrolase YbcI (DUF457 family)